MSKVDLENGAPEQGKTLLEILELEMRARAIRALLKQSGNEKSIEETKAEENKKNDLKDNVDEVVDLTECEDEESQVSGKSKSHDKTGFDENISSVEEKFEKNKSSKSNSVEIDKSKKLQAELELRNKLFKKKIYRTRQQRMENEEEDKNTEINVLKRDHDSLSKSIIIKKEPVEPQEITVEDPEEGEISTSEDEYPVEIKQEIIEPNEPENHIGVENFEPKVISDGERVTAIDNGTFVRDSNLENPMQNNSDSVKKSPDTMKTKEEEFESEENVKECELPCHKNPTVVSEELTRTEENESENNSVEEASWRDRWLQKDRVQKLVKSSKIYAKVKKRIAEKTHKAKEDPPPNSEAISILNTVSNVEVIEGSIKEYERLSGKTQDDTKQ